MCCYEEKRSEFIFVEGFKIFTQLLGLSAKTGYFFQRVQWKPSQLACSALSCSLFFCAWCFLFVLFFLFFLATAKMHLKM